MIQESEMERFRYRTWDTKEPETIAWIDSFSEGDVLFDVGANIGIYSLYAETRRCEVYAFEAYRRNFNRLVDNVLLNGFEEKIKLFNFMVSDKIERKRFDVSSTEIGSSGGQMVDASGQDYDYTRVIDQMVFFSFSFPMPNHVKIDIDGQELKVVRGMVKTIQTGELKSVLVEIDGNGPERSEIVSIFTTNGFTTENEFNAMTPHSRERRAKEGINVENIVFTRT